MFRLYVHKNIEVIEISNIDKKRIPYYIKRENN